MVRVLLRYGHLGDVTVGDRLADDRDLTVVIVGKPGSYMTAFACLQVNEASKGVSAQALLKPFICRITGALVTPRPRADPIRK